MLRRTRLYREFPGSVITLLLAAVLSIAVSFASFSHLSVIGDVAPAITEAEASFEGAARKILTGGDDPVALLPVSGIPAVVIALSILLLAAGLTLPSRTAAKQTARGPPVRR